MTSHALPTKAVDRSVLVHAHERRGFVTVPLDYAEPGAASIEVLYRVLPPHGGTPDDASKPFVFVINGGPGISARFYRPLDYDYAKQAMPGGGFDRFVFLPQSFRVVLIDQRGTDGSSAPLDMDDARLDARAVGRLYSSDSVARDVRAVIETLAAPGEPFYIIAQSYGGLPGMQYLALDGAPVPAGIVFSSSALPFEDPLANTRARRNEQLRLNLQLRQAVPDIAQRILAARAHLAALGAEATIIDGMYVLLGKGVPGQWEPGVVARLERLMGQSKAEIEAEAEAGLETPSLLNYILSSVNFSPGYTDRTLAIVGSREIPFEPWMIDEHEMIMRTGQDGGWREAMVADLDRHPPEPTPFPSLEALRAGIARTRALFTAADNDAFVPADLYREVVARFEVPGHTEIRALPGGHNAIFHAPGHEAMVAWAAQKA